jgi:lysozyme family protein
MMTDTQIIDAILAREGGYSERPNDPGGPTNWGITQAELAIVRGRAVSPAEVKALPEEEARQIYLRAAVVDTAVNFGITGATKMLQAALGVAPDGLFGPQSVGALKIANPALLAYRIVRTRVLHRASRVALDPSQMEFLAGWLSRDISLIAPNGG